MTNSRQTALSYPEFDFETIPCRRGRGSVCPAKQGHLRAKYRLGPERIGIFVGCFSEVKGWSKVSACIKNIPAITWMLVSKHEEKFRGRQCARV